MPSRIGDTTIGALGVAFPAGWRPTGEDRATVRAVAQILALWVHNGRLIAGLRDRVRELDRQALQLSALTHISRRVAASLDEGEAHGVIVAEARALVRADVALWWGAPGAATPWCWPATGRATATLRTRPRSPRWTPPGGRCARDGGRWSPCRTPTAGPPGWSG